MILIDRQPFTMTTVTGSAEQLVITNNSILLQVVVKPTTSSTTYDFSIEDDDDNVIYNSIDNQSTLNDVDISIPSGGNWTIKIDNASADEEFKVILGLRRG